MVVGAGLQPGVLARFPRDKQRQGTADKSERVIGNKTICTTTRHWFHVVDREQLRPTLVRGQRQEDREKTEEEEIRVLECRFSRQSRQTKADRNNQRTGGQTDIDRQADRDRLGHERQTGRQTGNQRQTETREREAD